ncbi:hypothetical protein BDV26DRAFT_302462 [Aspergillus bertholletiae]|uniref:Zn(2)-C6 fungal-type domain-containing protein n=1 Tax=Aspergillus bertholletiae TaxID=1226010 RepID=A0A5N7APM6_9EURO|nr:hypothetical protein BDV26DRAFT_302462 [Aspergillus bertholletiae]
MDSILQTQHTRAKQSIMKVNRQNGAPPYRQSRKTLSCAPCRKRKVKCDRLKPCSRCIQAKSQDSCTYPCPPPATPPSSVRSVTSTSSRPVPSDRLNPSQHSDVENHSLTPRDATFSPYNERTNASNISSHATIPCARAHVSFPPAPSRTTGQGNGQTLEQVSGTTSDPIICNRPGVNEAAQGLFVQSVSTLSFRGKKQRTRFFGRSHWATTLSMFPDLSAHLRDYSREKQRPTDSRFVEYCSSRRLKHDFRTADKQGRLDQQDMQSTRLKDLLPSQSLAQYLMHLYFATFETTFRVLHIPSFSADWNTFWESGQLEGHLACEIFLVKLLLLMACSSCLAEPEQLISEGMSARSLRKMSQRWLHTISMWLGNLSNHAQLNLDIIQIHCLVVMARQATGLEGDLAAIPAGSLIRTALLMGLHRDPCNFPNISPYWAEVRKRLWFTIVELELQTALYSGIPVAISWEDFDCPLPSNIEDEDFSVELNRLPAAKPLTTTTRATFQLALARTLKTRLKILKEINSIRLCASYKDIVSLGEDLTNGLAEAPPDLREISNAASNTAENKDPNRTFRASMFLFLHYRYLLALHRPFFLSLAERQDEPYMLSRRICVQASLAQLAQLEYVCDGSHRTAHARGSRMCPHVLRLKGGMFRDDVFHSAATICFELRLQVKDNLIQPLPGTISEFMDQSVFYKRMALFESAESAIRYYEAKVREDKQACKTFTILYILFTVIKSEVLHGSQPTSRETHSTILTMDDVCPQASRRCRDLLLEGEDIASPAGSHIDIDPDWFFSLDPLSPYGVDAWPGLDPFLYQYP